MIDGRQTGSTTPTSAACSDILYSGLVVRRTARSWLRFLRGMVSCDNDLYTAIASG